MHRLADRTWPEVGGASLLAVPVGSCEQHGPHLPLNTDTVVAEALVQELATRSQNVVVAPSIGIGSSGEHRGFAGTLSIGTDTLRRVLVEIGRSALPESHSGLPAPFHAVLFVNGHGGNAEAVEAATRLLRSESRRVHSWSPRIPDADAHAGHTETSLMLHLRPDLVRTQSMQAGNGSPVGELAGELMAAGVAAVSRNGVLGDPTGATAEHGESLFESLMDSLCAEARSAKDSLADRGQP